MSQIGSGKKRKKTNNKPVLGDRKKGKATHKGRPSEEMHHYGPDGEKIRRYGRLASGKKSKSKSKAKSKTKSSK